MTREEAIKDIAGGIARLETLRTEGKALKIVEGYYVEALETLAPHPCACKTTEAVEEKHDAFCTIMRAKAPNRCSCGQGPRPITSPSVATGGDGIARTCEDVGCDCGDQRIRELGQEREQDEIDALRAQLNAPPAMMSYNGRLVPINSTGMREVIDEAMALKSRPLTVAGAVDYEAAELAYQRAATEHYMRETESSGLAIVTAANRNLVPITAERLADALAGDHHGSQRNFLAWATRLLAECAKGEK